MNPIGIIICNYNKRDAVVECIRSVQESKVQNFDIYMVDNASADGSAEAVRREFGDSVTILQNKENLGGSGGFNTGLRIVKEKGYSYFVCLDNDVLVDENAINALYEYMEANPRVGMAGSRVYHMQMPEYIQQCGLKIDFDHCTAQTLYADQLEDGTLPEVMECDTVATCSVMIRGSLIRETDVGIMPEDNFIYWDDMEWGHRMHLAGYRIVTLAASRVLHQMGANVKHANTFINYYMWRNRANFFMRYTPEEKMDQMSIQILSSFFDAMYECLLREEHNIRQSLAYALFDAISGVRGKADEYKILKNDANDDKLIAYVGTKKSYCIITDGQEEDALYLRNFLASVNPDIKEVKKEDAEMILHLCPYIFKVKDLSRKEIYIDSSRSCIITEEDAEIVRNYEYSRMLFLYMNQSVFLAAAKKFHFNPME
ncbi:MAG: glycosyltransferase family 2 protein [Lachnospiraceae bacterium]|nr:glycosyltransferase family 2 protein [Lachnospiraceae bacterium]